MKKCKTCGAALPAETIERMLERFERYDYPRTCLFADGESDDYQDMIRNKWPKLIRGLMANVDQRPLLTPETVDAIPDSVCKAIWDGYHPPRGSDPAPWGRAILRAVAAHCRVPMPQPVSVPYELDSIEADRIIDRGIKSEHYDTMMEVLRTLRSRLTLKPRRLTPLEALNLVNFCIGRGIGNMTCYEDTGHAISDFVVRLWGLEVPEERPSQPAPAITAAEAEAFECAFGSAEMFISDDHPGYQDEWRVNLATARAVVERLKGGTVAEPVADKPQADRDDLEVMADDLRALDEELLDDGLPPDSMVRSKIREVIEHLDSLSVPAPVASVELSEAETKRLDDWMLDCCELDAEGVLYQLGIILAARSARDVADMRPPFEGPKHGFAVPDEANANVNGLTGEGDAP